MKNLLLICCFLVAFPVFSQIEISKNWEFRQVGTKVWQSAEVPGVVHLDLLRHGRIPDPFWGTNEKEVQWIETVNWEYRTTFIAPSFSENKNYKLVFEGLDTYATVFLNGKKILKSDNMFIRHEVNVKGKLKQEKNKLKIVFRSPIQKNKKKLRGLPYHLTAGNDDSDFNKVSVYTRKAPYQFGWDWGLRLVTSGIWKPIRLEWDGNEQTEPPISTNFDFGKVELVNKKDSIGTAFYFTKNGEPIFIKGANWVPPDPLLPRVSRQRKLDLLLDAKAVGINMIRVWGGGIYENEDFYHLCDSLGIMVWQDLMFACSMYPYLDMKESIDKEIEQQITRIARHPSVVIFCGNNEVDVAWHNWGWQNSHDIHGKDSIKMRKNYIALFDDYLPKKMAEHGLTFTPTSPLSNWGKIENFNHSSMHYWGVWHGPDRLDGYQKYVGRFMSEYGFQSFPEMSTIAKFADSTDWDLESEVMKHHQKSYIGNGLIMDFTKDYYFEPADFQDFVYKSQLTQRQGMDMAIRAHRKAKGHCWGTIYWQFNDTWPGPSWSSIDYYGKWKAFHYRLKELYADRLIIPEQEGDSLLISIDTDCLAKENITLAFSIKKMDGTEVMNHEERIELAANAAQLYSTLDLNDIFAEVEVEEEEVYSQIQLMDDGKELASTIHYFVRPKALKLQPAKVEIEVHENEVIVSSSTLVKDLFLSSGDVKFEENYFDLLPNETKVIRAEGIVKGAKIHMKYLN